MNLGRFCVWRTVFRWLAGVAALVVTTFASPAVACDYSISVGESFAAVCLSDEEALRPGRLCINGQQHCLRGDVIGDTALYQAEFREGDVLVYMPADQSKPTRVAVVPRKRSGPLAEILPVIVGGLLAVVGGILSGWAIAVRGSRIEQQKLLFDWRDRQSQMILSYELGKSNELAAMAPAGLQGKNFVRVDEAIRAIELLRHSAVLGAMARADAAEEARAKLKPFIDG